MRRLASSLALVALAACGSHAAPPPPPDAGGDAGAIVLFSERTADRTRSAELLFAAYEMTLSGAPLAARFGGRDLSGFDVARLPPDAWSPPGGGPTVADPFGFSAGIESAEYARGHARMLLVQTGAGVPLASGPLVAARSEPWALGRMRARAAELLVGAGADVAKIATLPAAPSDPENYLGFPGLWPTMAPYEAFDPSMTPPKQVIKCDSTAGFPVSDGRMPAFECQYQGLVLDDRGEQIDAFVGPRVVGRAVATYALLAADWIGVLHDANGARVVAVADADASKVGTKGNTVGGAGAYFGRTAYEGMWGAFAVEAADNAAEWSLRALVADGAGAPAGFASPSEALAYDAAAPLRYFPARLSAKEDDTLPYAGVTLAVADAASRSADLAALALGAARLFALTDERAPLRAGLPGLRAAFDGAPWPADDALVGGEPTPHDRALALLSVALVDLERLHADPVTGAHADAWDRAAGRGDAITTTSLAHSIVALRAARLALDGALGAEPTDAPDGADDARGALGPARSARVRDALASDARFLRDVLTSEDGVVRNGARAGVADAAPATLDAQAAAVRALSDAFRATGDESFRARARAVARRLLSAFYAPSLRAWRGVDGGPDALVLYAEGFAWLTGALRDAYVLLHVPADAALERAPLERVIARTNKLVLDGWDDRDGDGRVGDGECLGARLQLAEQVKTGELGLDDQRRYVEDRDGDCVWTISFAKQGSVLAGGVRFWAARR